MMVVVVMGPSGAGKTTVGRLLASELGWQFVDADDLHSASSVEKMRSSQPLTEEDRLPWLGRLRDLVSNHLEREDCLVLACSALRKSYREALCFGHPQVQFILLRVPVAMLRMRLQNREGHFMPASLLPSQLAAFEEGDDLVAIDASGSPPQVVQEIREHLGLQKLRQGGSEGSGPG